VHQLAEAMQDRTAATVDYLRDVVEYVLDQTDAVARNLDMVSLPQLYNRTGKQVSAACHGWYRTVVDNHPAYVRTMRRFNPPAFLEERERIDRIVAKSLLSAPLRNAQQPPLNTFYAKVSFGRTH